MSTGRGNQHPGTHTPAASAQRPSSLPPSTRPGVNAASSNRPAQPAPSGATPKLATSHLPPHAAAQPRSVANAPSSIAKPNASVATLTQGPTTTTGGLHSGAKPSASDTTKQAKPTPMSPVMEGVSGAGYVPMNADERAALRKFLKNKDKIKELDAQLVPAKQDAKEENSTSKERLLEMMMDEDLDAIMIPTITTEAGKMVYLRRKCTTTYKKLEEKIAPAVEQLTSDELFETYQALEEKRQKQEDAERKKLAASLKRARSTKASGKYVSAGPAAKRGRTSSVTVVHRDDDDSDSVVVTEDDDGTVDSLAVGGATDDASQSATVGGKRQPKRTETHLVACMSEAIYNKIRDQAASQSWTVKLTDEKPRGHKHDPSKLTEEVVSLAQQLKESTAKLQAIREKQKAIKSGILEEQKQHQGVILGYMKAMPSIPCLRLPVGSSSTSNATNAPAGIANVPVPEHVVLTYSDSKTAPAKITLTGLHAVIQDVLTEMFRDSQGTTTTPVEKADAIRTLIDKKAEFKKQLIEGIQKRCDEWKTSRAKPTPEKVRIDWERVETVDDDDEDLDDDDDDESQSVRVSRSSGTRSLPLDQKLSALSNRIAQASGRKQ